MAGRPRIFAALLLLGASLSVPLHATTASATTPTTVGDTTQADFDAGVTADALTSADGGGAVGLSAGSANFNGDKLPDGWTFTPTAAGGAATVANGQLSLDGGTVASPNLLRPVRRLCSMWRSRE